MNTKLLTAGLNAVKIMTDLVQAFSAGEMNDEEFIRQWNVQVRKNVAANVLWEAAGNKPLEKEEEKKEEKK